MSKTRPGRRSQRKRQRPPSIRSAHQVSQRRKPECARDDLDEVPTPGLHTSSPVDVESQLGGLKTRVDERSEGGPLEDAVSVLQKRPSDLKDDTSAPALHDTADYGGPDYLGRTPAKPTPPEQSPREGNGAPRWVWLAVVVAAVSILGLGVGWNATKEANNAERALASQTRQSKLVGRDLQALNQRLTQTEAVNTQLQNELVTVTDNIKITQGEVGTAHHQNSQISDDYSKKLTSVQSELAGKANAEDVRSLGGDVNGVKSELESTKNNLDMTRTEFGTLIARNHDEFDQLRSVGEHDYVEFTLTGKGKRSRVADLMVELRGTNVKKNQFTVALYVDDLRLEKKDHAIDEPIYFYAMGSRMPREFVVNQIGKDKVVGYVSVPNAQPRH